MPDALPGDAILLRRTPKDQVNTRGVFTPNRNDTDGLSVYLESASLSIDDLKNKAADPSKFAVARLKVSDILELGLSVVPDNDPDNPGHCLIPEFTYAAYKADKAKWVQVQNALLNKAKNNYH